MKYFSAGLSILLSMNAEAASVKSIKGKNITIKMSEAELASMETNNTYDMLNAGSNVGRVKVKKIIPGKGIVGTIEAKTPQLNSSSNVTMQPSTAVADTGSETLAENVADADQTKAPAKPAEVPPQPINSKLGLDFNLFLGTHELKEDDSDDSIFASNFGVRALYKFSGTPLGIGGHWKNNNITRNFSEQDPDSGMSINTELEFNLTSFGLSLLFAHDFGSFRPYGLFEVSSGQSKVKFTSKTPFGTFEGTSDPQKFTQQAVIIGGAALLGNFSIGIEYQAYGHMVIKAAKDDELIEQASDTTVKSTGFSVNLGYSL